MSIVESATYADPGDFDNDNDVDAADLLAWQRGESPNGLTPADLNEWKAEFPTPPATTPFSTPVPEPGTLALCGVWAAFMLRFSTKPSR